MKIWIVAIIMFLVSLPAQAAFVVRDADGNVTAVFKYIVVGVAEEFLSDDHDDVLAYLNPPKTVLSYEEFQNRFTQAEQDAMTNFVYSVDTETGIPKNLSTIQALSRAIALNRIDLLAPKTDTFLSQLVSAGAVSQARKIVILDPAQSSP